MNTARRFSIGRYCLVSYFLNVIVRDGEYAKTKNKKTGAALDLTDCLDDSLLMEIFQFVGKRSYRNLAGTSRRFRRIYAPMNPECMTCAEDFVRTISAAFLFCKESRLLHFSFQLKDRIQYKGNTDLLRDYDSRLQGIELVRNVCVLHGCQDVLWWVTYPRRCKLQMYETCIVAASQGHVEILEWAEENYCHWDGETSACQWWTLGGPTVRSRKWLCMGCPSVNGGCSQWTL